MHIRNVLLLLCSVTGLGQAQTGNGSGGCSIGTGFECIMVHASVGNARDERNWVRAIVLWKAAPWMSNTSPSREEQRAGLRRYDELSREAQDSGRVLLGTEGAPHRAAATITWGARQWRTEDTLFVLGQRFAVPMRDSALVIMLDARSRDPAIPPRLLGTAWIAAELDPTYWPQRWTSGDTSFTINPPRDNRILRDALEKAPAIRAFLGSSP